MSTQFQKAVPMNSLPLTKQKPGFKNHSHLTLDYSEFLLDFENFRIGKWDVADKFVPVSVLRGRWGRKFLLSKVQFNHLVALMIEDGIFESRQSKTGMGAWVSVKLTPLAEKLLKSELSNGGNQNGG